MSFTKTVSTVAALASIFGAGAAGWKLAQSDNQQPVFVEERVKQLEAQLKQQEAQRLTPIPPQPAVLPSTQTTTTPEIPPLVPPPPSEPQSTSTP